MARTGSLMPLLVNKSHIRQTAGRGLYPRLSLAYVLLLVGVIAAAIAPLSYWGFSGMMLCLWVASVGVLLLHEKLLVAVVLIVMGLMFAPAYELRLKELHQRPDVPPTVSAELMFGLIAWVAVAIVAAAALVWWRRSTPLGTDRVMKAIAAELTRSDGMAGSQISMAHLFGFSTAMCVAMAPCFYLGFRQGSLFSPFLLATGMLVVLKKHRLALLSCLAYPILVQFAF